MKRTLFITLEYPPERGGVANYWANLGAHFLADQYWVLAPEKDSAADFDAKQKYPICRRRLLSKAWWMWPKWWPLLRQTIKLVKKHAIQKIIVTQVLPAGTVAYLIKKFWRVSYVVSLHGLDVAKPRNNRRKCWLLKKILANAESLIVNSQYTCSLVEDLKIPLAGPIEVVYPCPCSWPSGGEEAAALKLREKYQALGNKIILTVGRLVERKGQDKVIEALPTVLKQIPEAVYWMVGQGNYFSILQKRVAELGLQDKVIFFTDVNDNLLPAFYQAGEVFIMPARILKDGDCEGFGIVYLDANLRSKPVIAGRTGGAVEAVEDGLNGLLVDPNDVSDIARALIQILESPVLAKEMGDRGRRRVQAQFIWSEQAAKVKKLLE